MEIISIIISIILSMLALIVSVISIFVSYLANKKYGDVAGTLITLKNQEQDAKRARITALQSLLNDVARIRKLANRNSELIVGRGTGMVRMPVTAFEIAFISGRHGLSVSSDLLDAVIDYLTEADTINSLVDICVQLALAAGAAPKDNQVAAVRQIIDISNNLPEILDRLDAHLNSELEAARHLLSDED